MKIPFDLFKEEFTARVEKRREAIDKLAARLADRETNPLYHLQRCEDAFQAAADIDAAWDVYNRAHGLCRDTGFFDEDELKKECMEYAASRAANGFGWSSSPTYTLADHCRLQAAGRATQFYGNPAIEAINEVSRKVRAAEREAEERAALWRIRKGAMWRKDRVGEVSYARNEENAGYWTHGDRPELLPGEYYVMLSNDATTAA